MSIGKKSLISTLKTTKKANLTGAPVVSQKDLKMKTSNTLKAAAQHNTSMRAFKSSSTKTLKQA
jgi:hypothetical protein